MEIRHIRISMHYRNAVYMLTLIQLRLQLFFCILSYVLLGNYISAQKVTNNKIIIIIIMALLQYYIYLFLF